MEATTAPKKEKHWGRLLDTTQAARHCGMGRSTFLRNRALGLIGPEPVKIGGVIRFDRVQLDEWIDAGCPRAEAWKAMQSSKRVSHPAKVKGMLATA